MIEFMLISGALMVGGCLGFFLAAVLSMGRDPRPPGEGMLRQTPKEIVAVYEARREMEARMRDEGGVYNDPALEAWEKEQGRKEKRRMR